MTEVRLATWNVNSIRVRLESLRRFVRKYEPDVVCLQETKVSDEHFPLEAVRRMGFESVVINGQKGYHGVATLCRRAVDRSWSRGMCGAEDCRHLAVRLGDDLGALEVHNFYVPAGGDLPDPERNPKFAHKLEYLGEMAQWMRRWRRKRAARRVVVGDLNVAPLENDVWSHEKLRRVVTHTPIEIEHLSEVQRAHDWLDVARRFVPPQEKLYTWWSYRAADWRRADKGRRLDHVWVSPALHEAPTRLQIAKELRGWKRASDHVPVLVTLQL